MGTMRPLLHELGHNVGMLHSKSACAEYGDESDVMGNGPTSFSLPHRVFMKWLPVTDLASVSDNSVLHLRL